MTDKVNKMNIAVIGAGPAGITAAYQLSKEKNIKTDLYESSSSVGGMAKSINLWGQIVDIGPHRFFSNDTRVNELWIEVTGQDYKMVRRLTRIYYKNKFFYYPIKPFNALINLGILKAMQCIISYFIQKVYPYKNEDTFEAWVSNRFGKKLYNIFFKTYSEKLWGISCKELDADFAVQRIKKLSLYEAIKNSFLGDKNKKHKTLLDEFAYPREGTGMVYERMKRKITESDNNIFLNSPVKRVLIKNGAACGIELPDGTVRYYDHIISSMPLTLLLKGIENVPAEIAEANQKLLFRNTLIVYLLIDGVNLFPDNWIYIHSDELKTGRITNFHNWITNINKGSKQTILAMEYWCNDKDEFWSYSDQQLSDLAKSEIEKTGLNKKYSVLDTSVYKIPRCYPVYKSGYKSNLKIIEDYLKNIKNLSLIGRYGAFKYNNQDHSILMGMLAAENIAKQKNHDLWGINTDYEYHENSIITKKGLIKNR